MNKASVSKYHYQIHAKICNWNVLIDLVIWEVLNAAMIQWGAVDSSFPQRNLKQDCFYWAALCSNYEFYWKMLGFCNITNLGLIWKYNICMHVWTTQELNILQVMDSSIQTHWMWEFLCIEHARCCKNCCVPCLTHILWFSQFHMLITVM